MGKSSIHIQPVKSSSEAHNNREKKLNYVREDLSQENSSFKVKSIAETMVFVQANYLEKVGQKMQEKATPIREGVLLIEKNHTSNDLKLLGEKLENRFGIKTIQGYCHKDEGHRNKETNEWKPNYHAHMVFDWTDHKTGKSIKLDKNDMAEFQTIVAEHLGMERGINSSKKHLNAIQFKVQQETQDLELIYGLKNGLSDARNIIEQGNTLRKDLSSLRTQKNELIQEFTTYKSDIEIKTSKLAQEALRIKSDVGDGQKGLESLRIEKNKLDKEIETLTSTKKSIEDMSGLERVNLDFLKSKAETLRTEIIKIESRKKEIIIEPQDKQIEL